MRSLAKACDIGPIGECRAWGMHQRVPYALYAEHQIDASSGDNMTVTDPDFVCSMCTHILTLKFSASATTRMATARPKEPPGGRSRTRRKRYRRDGTQRVTGSGGTGDQGEPMRLEVSSD